MKRECNGKETMQSLSRSAAFYRLLLLGILDHSARAVTALPPSTQQGDSAPPLRAAADLRSRLRFCLCVQVTVNATRATPCCAIPLTAIRLSSVLFKRLLQLERIYERRADQLTKPKQASDRELSAVVCSSDVQCRMSGGSGSDQCRIERGATMLH